MSNSKRRRRSGRDALPPEVEAVHRRIEHWRATREKRTRMPQPLWQAAAAVAHDHGLWFVSRALGVSYTSLKKHAGAAPATNSGGAADFVELPRISTADESAPSTTVLELSSGDATLTVRLEGNDAVDVPALVDAFWEHHR